MDASRPGNAKALARLWYEQFSRYAEDLYPGRYTAATCLDLARLAFEIEKLAKEKGAAIVAHNYLYPEFHELADRVGDSLGLSFFVRDQKSPRVDFESVFFMGETAKIITGDATRVFVPDYPEVIGCSLVFGIHHEWILNWKEQNPGGVVITYINSDAYTKSLSDYVSTSRNTDKIILHAAKTFPGRRILVLPDKFLGHVMKTRAVAQGADPALIDVYAVPHNGCSAACYVHEKIGDRATEQALDDYPDAELMIHPECGCASSCLLKIQSGVIPNGRAYFLSTEQMVEIARTSPATKFLVATEKGMIYRLRKEVPGKQFIPVSMNAECGYMKSATFEKLLRSLKEDRVEIVFCDDCCDPKRPFRDERVIHLPRSVAAKAKIAIGRMMEI